MSSKRVTALLFTAINENASDSESGVSAARGGAVRARRAGDRAHRPAAPPPHTHHAQRARFF